MGIQKFCLHLRVCFIIVEIKKMITFTIKLFEIKFKKVFVKLWKFFSKKVNDRKVRSVETDENLILLMKVHRKNLPTEK